MNRRIWFWLILPGAITFIETVAGCAAKEKNKQIERVRRESDKAKRKNE